MPSSLFKRDVSDEIIKYFNTDNIIVLHGARQVGKTSILQYLEQRLTDQGQSSIYFDLEDRRFVELLDQGVDVFLSHLRSQGVKLMDYQESGRKFFVFIDEIQYLTSPSPFLKLMADHQHYIQLIVSGSSSFDIKTKFSDSLVGRTVDFEIFNLSFREVLRFKNVSDDLKEIRSPIHLKKITGLYEEYVKYGGYPKIVMEDSIAKKEKYLEQIVDTYVRKDIRDLAAIKDIQKFNNLLKALAAQSGQLLNVAELSDTCALAKQTINHYLLLLQNTYIIQLVPPFSSSAKVEIVKTPKIFFYDTGLRQMLWLRQLPQNIFGHLLETSIFAELVKKYGRKAIHYWRTKQHQEIDFVVSLKNQLIPIEVKENFRKTSRRTIELFQKKYQTDQGKIVALRGEKVSPRAFYPWEL